MTDQCRYYDVNGERLRIRSSKPLSPADLGALADVLETLKAERAAEVAAIGPHEHQWKSPWRDGRMAGAFCTICSKSHRDLVPEDER